MSTQGTSLHVRKTKDTKVEDALSKLGVPCAVLAANRAWISLMPIGETSLDVAQLAQLFAAEALQVWFDEDSAVVFQIFAADGWHAEWSVSLDGSYALGPEDERLFAAMVERKLVSAAAAKELTQKLRQVGGGREKWLRSHGIEELIGLPFVDPLPVPCTDDRIRDLVPDAKVVGSAKRGATKRARTRASSTHSASTRAWSPSELAIVDLHFHYLTELWNMNDWKVYNRYKKHLPAERRREVDHLVDLMMTDGTEEAMRRALESILSAIWECEDWGAMIRDPELLQH